MPGRNCFGKTSIPAKKSKKQPFLQENNQAKTVEQHSHLFQRPKMTHINKKARKQYHFDTFFWACPGTCRDCVQQIPIMYFALEKR
jgi:hypothetical protein